MGFRVSRSGIVCGPVFIRLSRRNLAEWGFEAVRIGGLSLWSRTSGGDRMLASYHPRTSSTWHWSVSVAKGRTAMWTEDAQRGRRILWFAGNPYAPRPRWWHRFVQHPAMHQGQWHTYIRLPFGRSIIISQQDYHTFARIGVTSMLSISPMPKWR